MVASALAAHAQAPAAQLSAPDVNVLCLYVTQIMDAGGVAIPDLLRAAAPLIDNVKQTCAQLQLRPGAGQSTYALIEGLRAYLALADAVPKPFPFPDAARAQFAELRDAAARLDAHFRALLDSRDADLRSPDPDNLSQYQDANRRLPQPDPAKPRVAFLGDSIFEQWRLNEYFPDRDFVNRGINAQYTGQMLNRMKSDVIDPHPAAVVILGGTFDLARNIPLTTIEGNYTAMADLAEANNIKPMFGSVLPVSDYHKDQNPTYERTPGRPPAQVRALNEWLQSFCVRRGYAYLNYFAVVVDAKGQFREDFSDDGLHPNAKGYRIMAPLVLDAVEKLTQPPAASAKPNRKR
jgi:lysophospholipase L1-like esterase